MKVFTACCLSLLILCSFSGCKKDRIKKENLKVPRLMLESRNVNYGSLTGPLLTLPVSGTQIEVEKEPLVNEFEIANFEMVQVDMGTALMIQTTETGARKLYRGSVTNMGSRVVLTINGVPVGARRIDGDIRNGQFFTFVEIDDASLGQLVLDLKDSIVELQKLKHTSW